MNLAPVRVEHAHGEGARVRNHCEESGARTMVCLNWEMQQTRAFSAIHRALTLSALTRLLPELPETAEGLSKLEHIVWEIMKSFEEEGLRFVSSKEIDDAREP